MNKLRQIVSRAWRTYGVDMPLPLAAIIALVGCLYGGFILFGVEASLFEKKMLFAGPMAIFGTVLFVAWSKRR